MLDIDAILIQLAKHRLVFHSEADFQHAFAWEIHKHLGENASIQLEVPMPRGGEHGEKERLHLDIVVQDTWAIELKYNTIPMKNPVKGFDLRDHSAHDVGRYDFLKDIERLEGFIGEGRGEVTGTSWESRSGYAIMLTNDKHYWEEAKRRDTQDAAFRIHCGRTVEGTLEWADKRKYRGKLNTRIRLNSKYALSWKDYPGTEFKYLAVAVPPPS